MNVIRLELPFQLVMWYKPLDTQYNFDSAFDTTYGSAFPFKTCLRYNEMWDNEWTNKEISNSKTDIIICHHHNDYKQYLKAAESSNVSNRPQFFYIPHCSNPSIFKPCPNTTKDIDILISGVTKQKHYPLKHRLNNILLNDRRFKNFNVHVYTHPGYSGFTNFKSVAQNDYNKIINRSKVCIACTSKYKYRLGKYVEIPMAGGIIVGDEPEYDGQDNFNEFIVPIHDGMSNNKIADIITRMIQGFNNKDNIINIKRNTGINWAKKYTPKTYVDTFIKTVFSKQRKIFIISDEIRKDHPEFGNEKWICDVLKEEFYKAFPDSTTLNPMKADIIWYLAPWNSRYTPPKVKRETWLSYLLSPSVTVIFTQHHIDPCKLKLGQLTNQFSFMNKYGSHFHAICSNTMKDMKSHFPVEKTSCKFLWINNTTYFPIINKSKIRVSFGFNSSDYLIGSFQKDTEGKTNMPKLSKGPDIFVNIIKDMFKTNPNICVVLTGIRREYIINELTEAGIKYKYFNMVSLDVINQLYNCLDLYLVASRCEGGPRAIVECGLTNTPIISTRVGISTELMDERLLFDAENWETYKNAIYFKNSTGPLRNKVLKLSSDKYMNEFHQYIENTNNYNI
jgi:glycosyltransferase involved in cell wall biosynthesis